MKLFLVKVSGLERYEINGVQQGIHYVLFVNAV